MIYQFRAFRALFLCLLILLPAQSFARKELSFCPAGGPTGWMNYFDKKRDQNRFQNFHRRHAYPQHFSHAPVYRQFHPQPWSQPWSQSRSRPSTGWQSQPQRRPPTPANRPQQR